MSDTLVVVKVSLMCLCPLRQQTPRRRVSIVTELTKHHRRSSSPPSSPSSSSSSSPSSSSRYGATTASATASTSPSTQSPNTQPVGATASPTASSESPALPSHGGGIGRWPLAPSTSRRAKSWERLTKTSGRCLRLLRGRDRELRARDGSAESRSYLDGYKTLRYAVFHAD